MLWAARWSSSLCYLWNFQSTNLPCLYLAPHIPAFPKLNSHPFSDWFTKGRGCLLSWRVDSCSVRRGGPGAERWRDTCLRVPGLVPCALLVSPGVTPHCPVALSPLSDQDVVGSEAGAGAPSQRHLGGERPAPGDSGGTAGPGVDPGEAGPRQGPPGAGAEGGLRAGHARPPDPKEGLVHGQWATLRPLLRPDMVSSGVANWLLLLCQEPVHCSSRSSFQFVLSHWPQEQFHGVLSGLLAWLEPPQCCSASWGWWSLWGTPGCGLDSRCSLQLLPQAPVFSAPCPRRSPEAAHQAQQDIS